MIGAMPALTIRHRREKHDNSSRLRPEKICGKISKTHVVAVCALFGTVLLVSALIKVHHGAAVVNGESLALFITSSIFLTLGFILSCIKCGRSTDEQEPADTQAASVPLSSGTSDQQDGKDNGEAHDQQEEPEHHHRHHHHHHHHHHHQRPSVSEEV